MRRTGDAAEPWWEMTTTCHRATRHAGPGTVHDGTEGELYDLTNDPQQRHNLWDDPTATTQRDALLDDMWSSFPTTVLPRRP
ncbi:MAG: hypothetical protein EBV02_07565, partial [Actinobacteria bacterium]|nr:hypothetical protein [Actinomycetota bacterium]